MSDFEKSIIDSCLSDKRNLYGVLHELQPEDFESAVCQKALIAMSRLVKNGDPVTSVTLCDYDKTIPQDLFGDNGVGGQDLDYFIKKVQEQGKEKRLNKMVDHCQNILKNSETSIDEKVELVQNLVLQGTNTNRAPEMDTQSIGDAVLALYEDAKKRRLAGEPVIQRPTGIKRLDETIGGLLGATLLIIAGRQGFGKSTLAMDILFKLIRANHPTLYISLEQTSAEIFLYLVQKYSTFKPLDIKKGNLKPKDEPLLRKAIDDLMGLPLFLNNKSRTLNEIVTTIRTLHLTKGVGVVIVDNLQLIENPKKGEARHIEVAGISRTLKRLAMELDISIIALSQLNKEPEGRANKRIYLSDTRESEAITQDADFVIFLYRPSFYGDDEGDYISLAKNRHGPMINKIPLWWNPKFNRYED